jgi:hypothetical protein
MLRAQTGELGFARIEAIRQTAVRFRRAGGAGAPGVKAERAAPLHDLPKAPTLDIFRAFGYFSKHSHFNHARLSVGESAGWINHRFSVATRCSAHMSLHFGAGAHAGCPLTGTWVNTRFWPTAALRRGSESRWGSLARGRLAKTLTGIFDHLLLRRGRWNAHPGRG